METTVVCWCFYWDYIEIMEKKMETTVVYGSIDWDDIRIMERKWKLLFGF